MQSSVEIIKIYLKNLIKTLFKLVHIDKKDTRKFIELLVIVEILV